MLGRAQELSKNEKSKIQKVLFFSEYNVQCMDAEFNSVGY